VRGMGTGRKTEKGGGSPIQKRGGRPQRIGRGGDLSPMRLKKSREDA